jgi:hypothetical protein
VGKKPDGGAVEKKGKGRVAMDGRFGSGGWGIERNRRRGRKELLRIGARKEKPPGEKIWSENRLL